MEQNEKEEKIEQEQNTVDTEKPLNDKDTTKEETSTKQEPEEDHSRRGRKKRIERHNDELNAKVEEMGHKLAEMNDKYMRIYSEYENYRKRTSLEKAGLILNGGKDVIKLMLPIVDDMERAIANMAETDSAREGMQLILKNMLNALQQKGLKPMEAMGVKFDENYHEAITQIPAPTPEAKGTVIDVVKKGYFLNDEVLRFAQVVVAC
jgi:molecular chaperone GrpE